MLKNKLIIGLVVLLCGWLFFGYKTKNSYVDSHEQKVEKMIEITLIEKSFASQADITVDALIQTYPVFKKYKKELQAHYNEYTKTLLDNYRQACLSTYTEAETDALLAFYETPIGKKIAKKTPEFTLKAVNNDNSLQKEMKDMQNVLERAALSEQ